MGLFDELYPLRKLGKALARGFGMFVSDMGVLNRPNGSWVVGRTGFGPVGTGNETGLTVTATHSKVGVTPPVLEAIVQEDGGSVAERKTETDSVEVGEAEQVFIEREANSGMEVYRRRVGSMQGHSKGTENSNGVELTLGGISPGCGKMVGNILEGDMEEISVEVSRCVEREDTPVSKKLKLAVEVSNYVGLSCDGQEGLKVECLKQIVVEKYVIGGGSVNSNVQQEEDSNLREWGNCSDHEA